MIRELKDLAKINGLVVTRHGLETGTKNKLFGLKINRGRQLVTRSRLFELYDDLICSRVHARHKKGNNKKGPFTKEDN